MSKEIENFNSNFNDEIFDITFVLKKQNLSAGKSKGKYYTLLVSAIAYKNIIANEIIVNENLLIVKEIEDTNHYFQIFRNKTIVRLKVRKEKDSSGLYIRFLLEDIIDTNYKDNDLNIILEEYSKPVYYKNEELGDFELDKSINCFEKNMSWIDNNDISVSFNNIDEEVNKKSVDIIKKIFANKKDIDKKLKDYIAENMLEDANSWNDDDGKPHINKEEFIKLISLTSITIIYENNITFYFDDGDIFSGHVIVIDSDYDFNFAEPYIIG
ncbi:DUF2262 domain-containing protein [Brachyspira hyodysenteriae]|uniref:DUF2262 domain-containing protein n=1 Tax=Brachyspira hyodysenteriae TaxID=159 RepID=UPI00063DCC46|nr:DUF2262 domain-containing protein [Brachyspira hyodysenteriae]KLI35688.1 hypothetical protein SZ48_02180 [Brachyspira hyodysenteriae]KLI51375.1 hypothetical protein SZ42_06215 [Brachyspira hyodysenteriae]KLI59323.1 hypothetical protein SZ44_08850 [Brachyspira hyodysenteriae]MCZ9837838.1 DUF2262 domain-containing protein [Brachyspira hyodysenteriae]MCZ9848956.1 DUF2262 domain-containing protein [Brachyspira hyodysenteriae]